jgi:hypothetical protein
LKFGSFASLRDALVGREVPCRVRGCDRSWLWSKEELAAALARGENEPPRRMCASCHDRFGNLTDREVPCASKGCAHTFTQPRAAQLEAWVKAGRPGEALLPPRGLCVSCRQTLSAKTDRAVGCRLRGCEGTWTWTASEQIAAAAQADDPDPPAPKRLCTACEATMRTLSDQPVACRMRGCSGRWTWTRWSQIELLRGRGGGAAHTAAAGGIAPPSRLCERCTGRLSAFADKALPCRVHGCKNTFVYSARAQLEAELAGETDAPKRMCDSCHDKLGKLADRELPCKRPGCSKTWIWKRGAQLTSSRKRPPARFCDPCEAALQKLTDARVPCEHEGCPGSWLWSRVAQLMSGAKRPPRHACESCTKFLESAAPKEIPCQVCGRAIHWSRLNQLQTKLGRWVEPTHCGACKVG